MVERLLQRHGQPSSRRRRRGRREVTFVVVPFVHWPVFQREVARYYWVPVPVRAPDIRWGNNPDPEARIQDRKAAGDLQFFQRVVP